MWIKTFETEQRNTFISLFCFELWLCLSLFLGAVVALKTPGMDPKLLRSLFSVKQSAAMLAVSLFLPLVTTYLSVLWNSRGLLLSTVCCKLVLFSFSACMFLAAFPNSGWLVICLVLFTDWLSIIAYHWIWLRCFVYRTLRLNSDFLGCSFVLLFIFILEHFFCYPFTASLFIIK